MIQLIENTLHRFFQKICCCFSNNDRLSPKNAGQKEHLLFGTASQERPTTSRFFSIVFILIRREGISCFNTSFPSTNLLERRLSTSLILLASFVASTWSQQKYSVPQRSQSKLITALRWCLTMVFWQKSSIVMHYMLLETFYIILLEKAQWFLSYLPMVGKPCLLLFF